jgi:SPP1 gp7 family putative phage head morphogenesis protein
MTDYGAFYVNQTESDPTRTLTLRSRWVADWNRRIKALKAAITKVMEQDVFGFGDTITTLAQLEIPQKKFHYRYSHEKVADFMKWLGEMEERSLLEITQRPGTLRPVGEPWSNLYVRSAYQKGLEYARSNVNRRSAEIAQRTGLDVLLPPAFRPTGGAISAIMQQPFHADRLALAYTRIFEELKGVTRTMDQQISRVLAQGISEGLNPRDIGKNIANRVDNIGGTRGRLIARTETINIHAQAALNEYYSTEKSTGEVILVQWKATHDSRVRDQHLERDMRVYTKEEAYGLIGEPNCRCALLPYIPGIQGMSPKASEAARRASAAAIKGLSEREKALLDKKVAKAAEEPTAGDLLVEKYPWLGVESPPKFRDVEHAQTWCNKTYTNAVWDFVGCDVRAIQETIDSFHKLAVYFPEAASTIKYVGTYLGDPNISGINTPFFRFKDTDNSWAHAARDNSRLGLNPKWYGDYYTFAQSTDRSARNGWHPAPCKDIGDVVAHEFGHIVYNFYYRNIPSDWAFEETVRASGFGLFRDTFRDFIRGHRHSRYASEISDYALTSEEEAFAESFALLRKNPATDKKFSKDMGGFLDFISDAFRTRIRKAGEWRWFQDLGAEESLLAIVKMENRDEFYAKYGLSF